MSLSSAKITGGICSRASAKISGSIVDNTLSAPTNVMTRNAGNGAMEVRWTAGTGIVDHYDVYISASASGPFAKANHKPIRGTTITKIVNLEFGVTVYAKVRAVDVAGNVSAFSSLAVDAVASRATVQLRFTGPVGDVIPANAIFSARVNDEIVAVRALQSGTIS